MSELVLSECGVGMKFLSSVARLERVRAWNCVSYSESYPALLPDTFLTIIGNVSDMMSKSEKGAPAFGSFAPLSYPVTVLTPATGETEGFTNRPIARDSTQFSRHVNPNYL